MDYRRQVRRSKRVIKEAKLVPLERFLCCGGLMDDPDVANLSKRTLKRIDDAFDRAIRGQAASGHGYSDDGDVVAPPTVRRRRGGALDPSKSPSGGGGFIHENLLMGGGFIPESDNEQMDADHHTYDSNEPTHIPLTLIPTALQIIDLPPADEEVLAVFENAARGWGGAQIPTGEEGVSRKDFRAVCLALLPEEEDLEDGTDGSAGEDEDEELRDSELQQDGEYFEEESSLSIDEDSEEYTGKGKARAKAITKPKPIPQGRGKKRKRMDSTDTSDGDRPIWMTPRQKAECRKVFALFFPDIPESELGSQRIMIKDIVRVAGLLREKIKAEEVRGLLAIYGRLTSA
jgi:hypothetical protein